MGNYLEGKVAVVTGSGQGIGRAVALALAEQGAKVVTNNRSPGRSPDSQLDDAKLARLSEAQRAWVREEFERYAGDAESTAATIRARGGEAVACFGDISDFDAAGRVIRTAVDAFGGVDILVNVAGGFGFSPFEKMDPALFEKVTSIKPKGYFNTCRHAVPYFLEQGWGRIVNCTSRAWLGDIIRHAEYCTANAGVVGLTRALAVEYAEKGITANAFDPFARTRASVDLAMFDKTVPADERAWDSDLPAPKTENTPLPEEFAPFICYLCTDHAAQITGSVFSLGGRRCSIYSDPVELHAMTRESAGPTWSMEELIERAPRELFQDYHSIVERYRPKK